MPEQIKGIGNPKQLDHWFQDIQTYHQFIIGQQSGQQAGKLVLLFKSLQFRCLLSKKTYAELVSSFLAQERLRNEILALLHALSGRGALSSTVVDPLGGLQREFKWTGEDIHLIELVNGIHLTGQVNSGSIGIVELFKVVGTFFGVNHRVSKRGFDDLKARKTISRTAFLDIMRLAVLKKMDDDDAFDPGKAARRNGF
ncbi:RteC protein [Pedobacter terrae]|uniref:RteC protein n=1 Tax=Pedobacter terrae TaxID=405671 RepID=A0A1G8CJY3_9SPHI|nr:RteC domain-containing protein [Pedobacter terrae]SDH45798.1 RteC protein [Pedobacter terrae]